MAKKAMAGAASVVRRIAGWMSKAIFGVFLSAVLSLTLFSCANRTTSIRVLELPEVPNVDETRKLTGSMSEVAPPAVFLDLDELFVGKQPQVAIAYPKPDQVINDTTLTLKLKLRDLSIYRDKNLNLGPHLQVSLDNQAARSVYSLDEPIEFSALAPGSHTVRIVAAKPWGESFKNESAYAQTTFHVFAKTGENTPNPEQPQLIYSAPQGTYGAQPILLDFYLNNAPLHEIAQDNPDITDWKIRCDVNGQSFLFDQWLPIYLKGFKPGQNWVQLTLVDKQGKPIENVFNSTVRLIDFDPDLRNTLAQLTRGELSIKDAGQIVDPGYEPPAEVPVVVEPEPPVVEVPPVVEKLPVVEELEEDTTSSVEATDELKQKAIPIIEQSADSEAVEKADDEVKGAKTTSPSLLNEDPIISPDEELNFSDRRQPSREEITAEQADEQQAVESFDDAEKEQEQAEKEGIEFSNIPEALSAPSGEVNIFPKELSNFDSFSADRPEKAAIETIEENTEIETEVEEEIEAVDVEPMSIEPLESGPAEGKPAESDPVEAEPIVTEPIVTEPIVTEPIVAEPVERTAKSVEQSLEDILEGASEDLEDLRESAEDRIEETIDEIQDSAEDLLEDTTEDFRESVDDLKAAIEQRSPTIPIRIKPVAPEGEATGSGLFERVKSFFSTPENSINASEVEESLNNGAPLVESLEDLTTPDLSDRIQLGAD